MAEYDDIVDRADALMRPEGNLAGGHRRRSFIAAAGDRAKSAFARASAVDDDDLPVLTEVAPEEVSAAPATPAPPDRFDERLLSIIASDLVHTLEQQLAIELPTLIEATLLNAQNELRTGVNATLELALRDFLARRQQLRLPLDDPDHQDK